MVMYLVFCIITFLLRIHLLISNILEISVTNLSHYLWMPCAMFNAPAPLKYDESLSCPMPLLLPSPEYNKKRKDAIRLDVDNSFLPNPFSVELKAHSQLVASPAKAKTYIPVVLLDEESHYRLLVSLQYPLSKSIAYERRPKI